jgi:hypothetical protein
MLHWVVCESVHIFKKSFRLCHKSFSFGQSLIEKTRPIKLIRFLETRRLHEVVCKIHRHFLKVIWIMSQNS